MKICVNIKKKKCVYSATMKKVVIKKVLIPVYGLNDVHSEHCKSFVNRLSGRPLTK